MNDIDKKEIVSKLEALPTYDVSITREYGDSWLETDLSENGDWVKVSDIWDLIDFINGVVKL